jgi:hypothetical protein
MAVVCGEMLSEVIRRALLCYVEQDTSGQWARGTTVGLCRTAAVTTNSALISTQDRSETWLAAFFADLALVV